MPASRAWFTSCSCACVNFWLSWEDLRILWLIVHSEYGHIFWRLRAVQRCMSISPLLGLALLAFPLTAHCLPCGSGRVRCEVSVRRPLIPLGHLCTSTCLALLVYANTASLRQTSFSWWPLHNTIISLLTYEPLRFHSLATIHSLLPNPIGLPILHLPVKCLPFQCSIVHLSCKCE